MTAAVTFTAATGPPVQEEPIGYCPACERWVPLVVGLSRLAEHGAWRVKGGREYQAPDRCPESGERSYETEGRP